MEITEPRVIGERINPTGKKRFKEALLNNDVNYILSQAIEQIQAGADILDVNVGLPGIDEKEMMVNVINRVYGLNYKLIKWLCYSTIRLTARTLLPAPSKDASKAKHILASCGTQF